MEIAGPLKEVDDRDIYAPLGFGSLQCPVIELYNLLLTPTPRSCSAYNSDIFP